MELEPASTEFEPQEDLRPKMLPPPPVQLVAIADVRLPAVAGLERELDRFYIGLLGMERCEDEPPASEHNKIVYRTANVRLCLTSIEVPPVREDYRALGVIVPSLELLAQRLNEAKVKFVVQRGLFAGSDSLNLSDPTGNLIQVFESRGFA